MTKNQYKQLLDDFIERNPSALGPYEEMIKGYNLTYDIPKFRLFVKLAPNITDERRDYVANGIRSYFKDDWSVLLDKKVAFKAVEKSMLLFELFVGIVGTIALILAFFLLLISTTQNIRENVWEYGCLRAIGVTKSQGVRIFMYEQYSLILSSLTLGSLVGFILAGVVTAQFFLFMEFPFKFTFPKGLVLSMVVMALVTTFFAVYVPIKAINQR